MAASPTRNAVIADFLLSVDLELLFHRSERFVLHINKNALLKMGVSKVPGIFDARLWSASINAADVFKFLFHTAFYEQHHEDKWWTRRESNPRPQ